MTLIPEARLKAPAGMGRGHGAQGCLGVVLRPVPTAIGSSWRRLVVAAGSGRVKLAVYYPWLVGSGGIPASCRLLRDALACQGTPTDAPCYSSRRG
jgi:hypothetical protein